MKNCPIRKYISKNLTALCATMSVIIVTICMKFIYHVNVDPVVYPEIFVMIATWATACSILLTIGFLLVFLILDELFHYTIEKNP